MAKAEETLIQKKRRLRSEAQERKLLGITDEHIKVILVCDLCGMEYDRTETFRLHHYFKHILNEGPKTNGRYEKVLYKDKDKERVCSKCNDILPNKLFFMHISFVHKVSCSQGSIPWQSFVTRDQKLYRVKSSLPLDSPPPFRIRKFIDQTNTRHQNESYQTSRPHLQTQKSFNDMDGEPYDTYSAPNNKERDDGTMPRYNPKQPLLYRDNTRHDQHTSVQKTSVILGSGHSLTLNTGENNTRSRFSDKQPRSLLPSPHVSIPHSRPLISRSKYDSLLPSPYSRHRSALPQDPTSSVASNPARIATMTGTSLLTHKHLPYNSQNDPQCSTQSALKRTVTVVNKPLLHETRPVLKKSRLDSSITHNPNKDTQVIRDGSKAVKLQQTSTQASFDGAESKESIDIPEKVPALNEDSPENYIEEIVTSLRCEVFRQIMDLIDNTKDPEIIKPCIRAMKEIKQLLPLPGYGKLSVDDKCSVFEAIHDIQDHLQSNLDKTESYKDITIITKRMKEQANIQDLPCTWFTARSTELLGFLDKSTNLDDMHKVVIEQVKPVTVCSEQQGIKNTKNILIDEADSNTINTSNVPSFNFEYVRKDVDDSQWSEQLEVILHCHDYQTWWELFDAIPGFSSNLGPKFLSRLNYSIFKYYACYRFAHNQMDTDSAPTTYVPFDQWLKKQPSYKTEQYKFLESTVNSYKEYLRFLPLMCDKLKELKNWERIILPINCDHFRNITPFDGYYNQFHAKLVNSTYNALVVKQLKNGMSASDYYAQKMLSQSIKDAMSAPMTDVVSFDKQYGTHVENWISKHRVKLGLPKGTDHYNNYNRLMTQMCEHRMNILRKQAGIS